MEKANPELKVDINVIFLRSGQYYWPEIQKRIPDKDVFYPFWSKPASKSKEVEREWKWALESKGVDFIDPVPLVNPHNVPPPRELKTKHFNDAYLAHMGTAGNRK